MEKKTNPKYQKTSKSALVTSVLSLVLCFAMLIGTTLAWFTDSVTSAGNIIKSGTLDVTMEWKDATTTGAQKTYKDASEGAIFNNDLWEPGYVEAKNIKISNIGTLDFKYQLNIVATGEVSKLADVIDVYYAEGEYTLNDRTMSNLKNIGKLTDVLNGMSASANGDLLNGESDTVTIALKMQETAGNEYQDLSIGTDFSVQLVATQLTSEVDSFDDQYDIKATYLNKDAEGAWLINNADELRFFASQVNSGNTYTGETVKLVANIDLAGFNWKPAGNLVSYPSITFKGTFDGQGYTISNMNAVDTTVNHASAGFFGSTSGATIKNVTFKNATVTSTHYAGVVVGYEGANSVMTTIENVTVEGATVVSSAELLNNGEYDNGDKAGGIAGYSTSLTIRNCTVKDSTITGYRDIGGIIGYAGAYPKTEVTGNTVSNTVVACDYTHNYKGYTQPDEFDIGAIYGDKDGNSLIDKNTEENVTISVPTLVSTATDLANALAKNNAYAIMVKDIEDAPVATTAPYGNYYGVALNGGVLDGNGNTLDFSEGEVHNNKTDNYGIMTSGGTIKNVTVTGVFRAIMIMNPTETVYIDNVTIGDDEVCYAINTGEGDGTQELVVTNSTIKGWNSYGNAIKSVSFTNCTFAQGEYYTNVFGRLVKPYVDTVFENCEFSSKYYIDLSALTTDGDGKVVNPDAKVVLRNCTVNGVKLTAENWTQLIVAESDCGEGQISIEGKDGTYMTDSNIFDYVTIE